MLSPSCSGQLDGNLSSPSCSGQLILTCIDKRIIKNYYFLATTALLPLPKLSRGSRMRFQLVGWPLSRILGCDGYCFRDEQAAQSAFSCAVNCHAYQLLEVVVPVNAPFRKNLSWILKKCESMSGSATTSTVIYVRVRNHLGQVRDITTWTSQHVVTDDVFDFLEIRLQHAKPERNGKGCASSLKYTRQQEAKEINIKDTLNAVPKSTWQMTPPPWEPGHGREVDLDLR